MKWIILLILSISQIVLATDQRHGFDVFHPDAVGGQFIGTRQDASQVPGSGVGPGISLFLRYNLSPRILLDLSTGYTTVCDDIFKADRVNVMLFPNLTIKTNVKLIKDAKMTPFFYTGLMSAWIKRDEVLYNQSDKKSSYSDVAVLLGSGFIYKSYFNFTVTVNADYRYAFYSTNDIKSQYWVFEAGLSFPLKHGKQEPEFDDDYFTPQDENEVAVEEPAFIPGNDDFAIFLRKVESLLDRIDEKQRQLEDLEARVIANEKAIAAVTGFVASEFVNYTDVQARGDSSNTYENYMTLYQNALVKYNSNQFAQAIRMFEKLLYINQMHPLASNCQYWIGECHHALGDYGNAAKAFSSVLEYSLSSKYDDALLMNGVCQMKLGNKTLAREYFSELITRYPDSEFVTKANEYLATM